jgi:hypothetical protein
LLLSGVPIGAMVSRVKEREGQEEKKQTLDLILGKYSKSKKRQEGLKRLAELLKQTDCTLNIDASARGWCYLLENQNLIDKTEFDRAEDAINECRRLAYLPIDFCAEDSKRVWDGVEEPTGYTIEQFFRLILRDALNAPEFYIPDWWEGEKYYLQMLVEKIDLKSLFGPVCEEYHVPIANAGGQSDLNVRHQMAMRFKAAEERGQIGVLLYCRDFDAWGDKIAKGIRTRLREIQKATGYDPKNLIIDHFGLNYDFIKKNKLTWIDNLKTSRGKDNAKSYYCYNCEIQHQEGILRCRNCNRKLYVQPKFVRDFIAKYGERKCEANALVVVPDKAEQLARKAIEKYLGVQALSRFETKRDKIRRQFERFRALNPKLFEELEMQNAILTATDEADEDQQERDR